jgi:hypothetical protein
MTPLLSALQEVDSRLSIGMAFDEYGDRIGDAKVAYDRLDFKRLNENCIFKVGIALESGLNHYIDANNIWDECIDDFDCSVEGAVLQKMRKHWSESTERIEAAVKNLNKTAVFKVDVF